jgi:hypothetical protein
LIANGDICTMRMCKGVQMRLVERNFVPLVSLTCWSRILHTAGLALLAHENSILAGKGEGRFVWIV